MTRLKTLVAEGITFTHNAQPLIQDPSLSLNQREIVALTRPSGTGKTTLLKILAQITKPHSGRVAIHDGKIAYMAQEDLLLPWRSVLDNLLLPLELGQKKEPKHT